MVSMTVRRTLRRSLTNNVSIREMDPSETFDLLGPTASPVPNSSANRTLSGVRRRRMLLAICTGIARAVIRA